MAKKSPSKKTSAAPETANAAELESQPPSGYRPVITILLLFHLTAVLVPPLNFATTGSGPSQLVFDWMRPYIQSAYLDHGYFFFAPNPGASHLVRYRAEFEDGREPVEDMFPDKHKQWPRLLYHRHFMLSEHLHAAYAPPEAPPNLEPAELQQWGGAREIYESRWAGFVNHLKAKHQADRIEMFRVEHRPPGPLEFIGGTTLTDESLYVDLSETMPEPENETDQPDQGGDGNERQGPLGPAPLRPDLLKPNPQPKRPLENIGPNLPTGAGQGGQS